jgi:hypothetical protein
MTATRVDFTSHVDQAGYKLIPGWMRPLRPGEGVLDRKTADIKPARIVGKGGRLKRLRLDNYPMLFNEFAKINTSQGLLAFVTEYGPLTNAGVAGGAGDVVPSLLDQAKRMKGRLQPRRANIPPDIPMTRLWASLSTDRKGTVSLKIFPATFLDALWLQFGQALTEGAEMHQCKHCQGWFPVGGKSGRRLDAEYCSNEHRKRFHSLARSR